MTRSLKYLRTPYFDLLRSVVPTSRVLCLTSHKSRFLSVLSHFERFRIVTITVDSHCYRFGEGGEVHVSFLKKLHVIYRLPTIFNTKEKIVVTNDSPRVEYVLLRVKDFTPRT